MELLVIHLISLAVHQWPRPPVFAKRQNVMTPAPFWKVDALHPVICRINSLGMESQGLGAAVAKYFLNISSSKSGCIRRSGLAVSRKSSLESFRRAHQISVDYVCSSLDLSTMYKHNPQARQTASITILIHKLVSNSFPKHNC